MFGWLKGPVFRSEPPSGELRIRIGSAGRYRWFLYDNDGHVMALCPVQGYASREEAKIAYARAAAAMRKVVEK